MLTFPLHSNEAQLEVNRQLGRFRKCISLVSNVDGIHANAIKEEAVKMNSNMVRLI